ncbi:hypothetical protein A4H97_08340 [Niastella yeongjuensis]|uniref:2Fe-2S ferredoxin-type domain-containing protein n=1 Tax=Niastella yeongjuensis TaxID=354355 RepID=A0A1V9EMX1_9BACT|nr:2Fe-2S iron-sulfur cluster-binding protein [Niastella yeongjuensis]OQP47489.1 hypothetical protein A4H97_08340 [Niastella yeongjuensis]SEN86570.1 Ferredoxin [Niastella yeongjuensis]
MATNKSYTVTLLTSNKEILWDQSKGSLLELSESAGLEPEHSCRVGTCATCATKLVTGTIEYDPEPFMEPSDNHILICCAHPTSDIVIEL